jgi:hypothetical protein
VRTEVDGSIDGRACRFTAQVIYDLHRDSWINGLVIATAARWVAEGSGVRPGVHFLAEAVDPVRFMEELRRAGVAQTEDLTFEV